MKIKAMTLRRVLLKIPFAHNTSHTYLFAGLRNVYISAVMSIQVPSMSQVPSMPGV